MGPIFGLTAACVLSACVVLKPLPFFSNSAVRAEMKSQLNHNRMTGVGLKEPLFKKGKRVILPFNIKLL